MARAASSFPVPLSPVRRTETGARAAAPPDPRAGGFSAWLDERIASAPPEAVYESLLEALERPLLEKVMRLEKGNQVQAAKRLGIHRTTLRGKLQKYGMLGSEA